MTLAPGTRLGPYEIGALLGAGGMGEVYRARDPRIGRDVAVKVLPAAFSSDPERLRRFEQEARSAGQLNHPGILAIFDVGTHQGAPYVVAELLEGETLRERLKAGPLSVRRTLEIGAQIAHGLAAAHERGILHRDLKPDNLFITKDGRAKILDFGLAKLTGSGGDGGASADAPTLPADTGPGAVWGTVGYMSPEQVRGNPADHRSDIFAFGTILYEMLSGKRAFHGDSSADTMSAILKEDPADLSATNEAIPPALERLVRHCLEKSPGQRFQSARDLAFDLESLSGFSGSRPAVAATGLRGRRRPLVLAAAAAGVVIIAGAVVWIPARLRGPGGLGVVRATLESPSASANEGTVVDLSISPNGRLTVFTVVDSGGNSRLWLRPLDAPGARPVEGTAGGWGVFWSPDSRHIGFFADEKLKRAPVAGGPVEVICDAPDPRGATWSRRGVILFAPGATGGLFRVPAEGGAPAPATTPDSTRQETAHRWPCFLPDGKHFLYLTIPVRQGEFECFVGSLDSGRPRPILRATRAPVYAEPGFLVYTRGDLAMAQRFDLRGLKLLGKPVHVSEATMRLAAAAAPAVAASRNGIIAYMKDRVENSELRWATRSGELLGRISVPPGRYEDAVVSPDGRLAVLVRRESHANRDLWLAELDRGTTSRLTFDPGNEIEPRWSADGSRIAYCSDRDGIFNLYAVPASGGESELLYRSAAQWKYPAAWSPDGRSLLFRQLHPQNRSDLWILPLSGERTPIPYLCTPFSEQSASLSPDGRWLLYASDESGDFEVYVRSFPRPEVKHQVSTGGAFEPVWGAGGREILYGTGGKEMSVSVRADTRDLRLGAPRQVFEWPLREARRVTAGSYSRATERWLLAMEPEMDTPSVPSIIMNWPELARAQR